jgi:hypothetical protein
LKAERFNLRKAYELQQLIDEDLRKLLKAKEEFLRKKERLDSRKKTSRKILKFLSKT